ncbi:cellulose-binding protein [Streptomyces sp. NPDC094034]|uniref:cellulose-binding protein n=1 Tax=Streptomyces sp. NPDC094034 TaxID=3155309 RepID=UPI003328636E
MAAAPLSAHGFAPVRGRGYRPEQVEREVTALFRDRDDAWERVARLTVLAKEMEGEAERLRERVAALPPQTYEKLGHRAQQILALAKQEDETVRTEAREESQAVIDTSRTAADQLREAARQRADAVRAEAEAYAGQVLRAARGAAEAARAEARREVTALRAESLAALKEVRRRTQGVIDEQERKQDDELAAAEREFAEREAASRVQHDELTAYAQLQLMAAQRAFSEAGEQARHGQEDAGARAEELLARARADAEGVARDTERLMREHSAACEEMRAHMAHVRTTLAALTGRAPTEE